MGWGVFAPPPQMPHNQRMALVFEQADLTRHRAVLMRFNVDYATWIAGEVKKRFGLDLVAVLGTDIETYVAGALDKLCEPQPPEGVFYVATSGAEAVGMGGLRRIRPGVCELKRIYVPRTARGGGFGAAIFDRLMADARAYGYPEAVLETGPFMTSAHRIYEAAGFVDIAPYAEAEVPQPLHHDWRFMRCALRGADQ